MKLFILISALVVVASASLSKHFSDDEVTAQFEKFKVKSFAKYFSKYNLLLIFLSSTTPASTPPPPKKPNARPSLPQTSTLSSPTMRSTSVACTASPSA